MIRVNGDSFAVTGSSGFIGSHIVEELRKQGKRVMEIDLPSCDVTVDHLDFRGVDTVFHQACGKCTVCRNDPKKDLMTNAWGSFRVFDAAASSEAKVVHASTGSVYGDNQCGAIDLPYYQREKVTDESVQYASKSFYGVSKLAGEQYLRAFHEYYGLRFVGLRYFHVYGPRQNAGPNGGVVAIFITKILRGEPITIFGDGEQVRSFTYVKDVVNANFHAANSELMNGDYFNVASGIRISLNHLVERIEAITGKIARVEYAPTRQGDIRDFNVSNAKIGGHGMTNWTSFEDGLKETVESYRDNS